MSKLYYADLAEGIITDSILEAPAPVLTREEVKKDAIDKVRVIQRQQKALNRELWRILPALKEEGKTEKIIDLSTLVSRNIMITDTFNKDKEEVWYKGLTEYDELFMKKSSRTGCLNYSLN
jgi:hypothetical protein